MSNLSHRNLELTSENGDIELYNITDGKKQDFYPDLQNDRTSPTFSNHGTMRTSLKKLNQEKKAKKLKFFGNGDRFFKGLLYVLSVERIRSFDSLLEDLTRVLVDKVNLPKGVRYIFAIDGKDKILSLDQFNEEEYYVCSSNDHYIKLDYQNNEKPEWSLTKKLDDSQILKWESDAFNRECRDFIRPKLIAIIKNGLKPRKAVRVLLNKKTAHSFNQVLNVITEAIQLDSGPVRKIFTLSGKQVMNLIDFFSDEDIFIAYGPEKYSHYDFDLDSEESKYLVNGFKSSMSFKNTGSLKKYTRGSGIFNDQSTKPKRRVSSPYSLNEASSHSNSSRGSFSPLSVSPSFPSRYSRTSSCENRNHIGPITLIPNAISQKYDIGKVIGDGNFAVVYICVNRSSKTEYALKIIDKTKCKGREHLIENEVSILRRVKHNNIVQLIEEFDCKNDLYLIMELVKGGDLFDAIASATKYTEKDACSLINDLSSALCYLHSMNIVHRDIKPENLLVYEKEDGSSSLKLGDFGLAMEILNDDLYVVCGTPTYVAPEILTETGYGLKVDIWAAGVITYILLCGFPPFVSRTNDQGELFDQILAGKYEFTSPYWDEVSECAKELITMMLQVNPNERCSAADVLEHPWILTHVAADTNRSVSRDLNIHFDHQSKSLISLIAVSS